MKTQPISYADNHTSFGARLKLGGSTAILPEKVLKVWAGKASAIGTDADAIIIHLGAREETVLKTKFLGLIPQKLCLRTRAVFGVSDIKGKNFDKDLGYYAQKDKFDEVKFIAKTVNEYLKGLSEIANK